MNYKKGVTVNKKHKDSLFRIIFKEKKELLNINYGHNRDLMEKCKKLWEYSAFIAAIRKYLETEYELETAVQLAMDECIRNNILAEILRKERAVVMSSILEEFDEAAYADMLREEGYEEGIEQGIEQGKREMLFNMLKNGMDIKQIAQITEMSEKEVETIEEERNKIESGKK